MSRQPFLFSRQRSKTPHARRNRTRWYVESLENRAVPGTLLVDAAEEIQCAAVCVLGEKARVTLLGYGQAVGQFVKVNDTWLQVVGVLGPRVASAQAAPFPLILLSVSVKTCAICGYLRPAVPTPMRLGVPRKIW